MAFIENNLQLTMTEYPIFAQFIGYLVMGQVPQEMSDLVDQMPDDEIPEGYHFIVHMWQNRNRDPKLHDEIVQYIQQKVKESMP